MSNTSLVPVSVRLLREQIPFLRDLRFIRDTRGHSRTFCYIVENATERFFLKIYPGNRLADLQKIESIYNRLHIPTAQIVEQFYLAEPDTTACLYQYITGATVQDAIAASDLPDIESLGYHVGVELRKFSTIRGDSTTFQQQFEGELSVLIQNTRHQCSLCAKSKSIELYPIDLDRLERSCRRLVQSIYDTPPTFTHGDLNLNNIILHHDERTDSDTPYFIDTDDSKIKSRALDFRGNCWWGWDDEPVNKERAFYRGVYRGIFADCIPADFHSELGFAIIYEFFLRNQRYAGNLEQIQYSFSRWHEILTRANYFENYRFTWF